MKIVINGFGGLFFKLKEKYKTGLNLTLDVPERTYIRELISILSLKEEEVEAVFINGKIRSFSYILKDKDRVGLVPPGIPGPYRFLLGIRNSKNRGEK